MRAGRSGLPDQIEPSPVTLGEAVATEREVGRIEALVAVALDVLAGDRG